MTGFIKGLFGSKPKADNLPSNDTTPIAPKESFYLTPDDAKTFGDIDYMRTSKSIRRSFPKAKLGADNEFVQDVSATKAINRSEPEPTFNQSNGASAPPSAEPSTPSPSTDRRRGDSSMDLFRNMARDIRKG